MTKHFEEERCSCIVGKIYTLAELVEYESCSRVLEANTAFEMVENPPEANEKLIELLRLE